MMTTVKLSSLGFGNEIDSRSNQDNDITSLANSIAHLGLILPLAVVKNGKGYKVIDGNRRLRALLLVHADSKDNPDIPVNIHDVDEVFAREQSLAANIERLPLHPMDQFEAFARLAALDEQIGSIALRFGLTERAVRQRMALGALAEPVRQAYRDGGINDATAQKLTRLDEETQVRLLYDNPSSWRINDAIDLILNAKTLHPDSPVARFVTRETYLENGGTLARDLFCPEGKEDWTDTELAHKLLTEEISRQSRKYLDEGWQFFDHATEWVGNSYILEEPAGAPVDLTPEEEAEIEKLEGQLTDLEVDEVDPDSEESDERVRQIERIVERLNQLQDDKRDWSDEQKTRLGVVIDSHYRIYLGAQRRAGAAPAVKDVPDAAGSEPAEKPLANALLTDLDDVLTNSAAHVLATDHGMAIRLLVLQLMTNSYVFQMNPLYVLGVRTEPTLSTPLDSEVMQGFAKAMKKAKTLEGQMKALWKLEDAHIHEILAWFTASALRRQHRGSDFILYLDKLGKLETRRHWTPTVENFFGRLSKKQLADLLKMEGFEDDISDMKKADAAQFVCDKMPADWLPDAIRPTKQKA